MTARTFSLGAVLSVTTGRLLCDLDTVSEILNWLCDDKLFTHQLPRAFKVARPYVLAQFPALAAIDASGVDPTNWREWLAGQITIFGDAFEVRPLERGIWTYRDPVEEAQEMVGADRVVVVDAAPNVEAP